MRIVNRLLAAVVALVLVAFAVVFTVEVTAAWLAKAPVLVRWHGLYDDGTREAWGSRYVRALAIGLTLLGALLVLLQLRPRRPDRLRAVDDGSGTDTGFTRAGVRAALRSAARDVDGIGAVSVRLRRSRARVVATSRLADPSSVGALRAEVDSALQERLDGLQLRHPPRVRLRVLTRDGQE